MAREKVTVAACRKRLSIGVVSAIGGGVHRRAQDGRGQVV